MTDKAKHTPGPWDIGNENNETCEVCLNSPHNLTVSLDRHDQNTGVIVISRDEMLANAHLIAAAPELLDAAQLALKTAESWIHDQLDGTSGLESALEELSLVRAAIAKARGES